MYTEEKDKEKKIELQTNREKCIKKKQAVYTHYYEQNAPAILVRQTILNEHERRGSNSCNTQK